MTTTYVHIYTDTNPITLPCSLARAGKNVETVDSTGFCSRVVLDLLEGFEHSNIHVYMISVVPIYILHWLVKGLVCVVLPGPIEKTSLKN